jgi:hypothetical protein
VWIERLGVWPVLVPAWALGASRHWQQREREREREADKNNDNDGLTKCLKCTHPPIHEKGAVYTQFNFASISKLNSIYSRCVVYDMSQWFCAGIPGYIPFQSYD